MKNTNSIISNFLNSIWLVSTVKEWIFRMLLSMLIPPFISLLSMHKHGMTTESVNTLLLSLGMCLFSFICFIIFLYSKFHTGKLLRNKQELFKNKNEVNSLSQ